MTWSSWIACICGPVLAAGVANPADAAVTEKLGQVVRVRIYNYASVSPATLAGAEAAASHVLLQAGVRVEWAECLLVQNAPRKDPTCDLPVTPLDLQLRILDEAMARRVRTTSESLGYAVLAEGFDSIAAVYFHRAVELEKRSLADRQAILGSMLAHEIGHLLLKETAHSGAGIMQAQWGDGDLKLIGKGRLWFTEREAVRLKWMIARRREASKTSPGIAQLE